MASITIRNLSDETKENLRMRAAKNGCSMEEEARRLLSNNTSTNANFAGVMAHQANIAGQTSASDVTSISALNASSGSALNASPASISNANSAIISNAITFQASDKKTQSLQSKSILLIIGGGIAAYKSLDLIRRLSERGAKVTVVMTHGAQQFITPLAAGALAGGHVYTELFSRQDEQDIGHIRLARNHDAIILAPATADRMAKIVAGMADDLAGAVLLAAQCPILLAPAMNPAMWANPATKRNAATLAQDGFFMVGPEIGEMAERGEAGRGRMSEPLAIVAAIERALNISTPSSAHANAQMATTAALSANAPLTQKPLSQAQLSQALKGKHIIVTSGPTHEPIDPIRYLANRSSGKQGHAIASHLQQLGAHVTLVSGPVAIADPLGVDVVHVETARDMLQAVESALPADAGIFVAAVADWRSQTQATQKIKKQAGEGAPVLKMVENPDILATIGHATNRPKLVIGFAAETFDVVANAQKKLAKKGADFIIANDVSTNSQGKSVMGGDSNTIEIIGHDFDEKWPEMDKAQVAEKIANLVANFLEAT